MTLFTLTLLSPSLALQPPLSARTYDLETLKQEGFIDEREAPTSGRLSNTLTALGPGLLLHGVGHWRMRDHKGGNNLLSIELLGVGALLATSLSYHLLKPTSFAGRSGVELMSHLGWGLFLSSWAVDVIGAYQGALSFTLEPQAAREHHLSLGYRYLSAPLSELSHHLITRYARERRRLSLSVELDLESRAQVIGALLDARFSLTQPSKSALFKAQLGLSARRWRWAESDTTQLALTPYIAWSLSLAKIARGLSHTRFFQRLGVGWEGYQSPSAYASELGRSPNNLSLFERLSSPMYHERPTLLAESGLMLSLFKETTLSASYLQDPTHDVARRPWARWLWGAEQLGLTNNTGSWRAELTLRQSERVDFVVEAMVGARWSTWLTVRYALSSKQPSAPLPQQPTQRGGAALRRGAQP